MIDRGKSILTNIYENSILDEHSKQNITITFADHFK